MLSSVVLGIDPSLNSTGWAIVKVEKDVYNIVDYGSIVAKSGGEAIEKIKNISNIISGIIKKYNISTVSIEECFVNKNASSSLKLGMVRGAVISIASMMNTKIFEYSPKEVKISITGKGSATKDQVASMISHIIHKQISFKNEDESDAIGVALTHFFYEKNRFLFNTTK